MAESLKNNGSHAGRIDLQTLHRARSRVVGVRQTLLNQLRAILLERGITARKEDACSNARSMP